MVFFLSRKNTWFLSRDRFAFLGHELPLATFLDGVLSIPPSLFHHGHLFAVPTYSRHREKHWRVSGHSNNAFRVALDDFTRAEFGDFRKIYTETAQRGVVSFFGRKCSVSARTESTSALSQPPTGSMVHLKRFNFVLCGQLSTRRWS